MSHCLPPQSWLACPANPEQTDAYWQAVTAWRAVGIELALHPIALAPELPWARLRFADPWQGLVLWSDATGQRLRSQANAHGVPVRRLARDPREGLQAWLGD